MCIGMKENLMVSKILLSFELLGKSIWKSESIAGFSQHRCIIINRWNPVLLYAGGKSKHFSESGRINWLWAATRYVLPGNPAVLATDVTGISYMCYRGKRIMLFWKQISTDTRYYPTGTVSVSVSMCKGKRWLWLVYEIGSVVLCNFSNLLVYSWV